MYFLAFQPEATVVSIDVVVTNTNHTNHSPVDFVTQVLQGTVTIDMFKLYLNDEDNVMSYGCQLCIDQQQQQHTRNRTHHTHRRTPSRTHT